MDFFLLIMSHLYIVLVRLVQCYDLLQSLQHSISILYFLVRCPFLLFSCSCRDSNFLSHCLAFSTFLLFFFSTFLLFFLSSFLLFYFFTHLRSLWNNYRELLREEIWYEIFMSTENSQPDKYFLTMPFLWGRWKRLGKSSFSWYVMERGLEQVFKARSRSF